MFFFKRLFGGAENETLACILTGNKNFKFKIIKKNSDLKILFRHRQVAVFYEQKANCRQKRNMSIITNKKASRRRTHNVAILFAIKNRQPLNTERKKKQYVKIEKESPLYEKNKHTALHSTATKHIIRIYNIYYKHVLYLYAI